MNMLYGMVGACILLSTAASLADECGQAPALNIPAEHIENYKSDLRGIASGIISNGTSSEQIVSRYRRDVFAKYEDLDKARSNAYFQYVACRMIMSSSELTAQARVNLWNSVGQKIKRELDKPARVFLVHRSRWIDTADFGSVDAALSDITLYINDKEVNYYDLREAAQDKDLKLSLGRSTFKFQISIYGKGEDALQINSNCFGFVNISDDAEIYPYLLVEKAGNVGRVKACKLYTKKAT